MNEEYPAQVEAAGLVRHTRSPLESAQAKIEATEQILKDLRRLQDLLKENPGLEEVMHLSWKLGIR